MFQQAPLVAILLSHLTPDRLVQSLSLFERYHRRADSVRERTQHILLAEDRAELVSLADELRSRLAEMLNPTDLEELVLRVHWAEDLASDRHFELANITGDELRQVVHQGVAHLTALMMRRYGLEPDDSPKVSQSALDAQARYEAALQSALDPITAETLNALRSTLGDRGFDAYQEYAGAWLRELIPGQ